MQKHFKVTSVAMVAVQISAMVIYRDMKTRKDDDSKKIFRKGSLYNLDDRNKPVSSWKIQYMTMNLLFYERQN